MACSSFPLGTAKSTAAPGTDTPSRSSPTPPPDVYAPAFAEYPSLPVSLPASFSGGYTLPVDLAQVEGMDLITLNDAQKDALSKSGFVVTPPQPGQFGEFYQLYESLRYELDQPVFVTTDSILHAYHLIFDKMLRDLERDYFIADIQSLTSAMLSASHQQYQQLSGTALEEPARRNVAYFGIAAKLLDLPDPIPAEATDIVDAETALIMAHAGWEISPDWDREDLLPEDKYNENYGLYLPRGHYTKSEELKRYFRAMTWYGRMNFRLRDTFETRRALLLTQALRTTTDSQGTPVLTLWQNVYEPTVFIVGKTDDLSYVEYGTLSDSVFGKDAQITDFADDSKTAQFMEAARLLPPPKVNSMWVWITQDKTEATQGFRVMGQRYTLDEDVFGQLIWRNVGTLDDPRGLPKALDFFAGMGSEEALAILRSMGEDHYQNFDSQLTKVKNSFASLDVASWTQNLYWSWLYTLQPLASAKDERFPAFMQTQAWTRKDLQTALGSYTELKHDTLLYAKQVMAELGGGAPETLPHGYVEPNPEVYTRLRALALMTKSGLESRGLLDSESSTTGTNLDNLVDLLAFLQATAEKELSGQPLDEETCRRIQYFGGELENLTLAAADKAEDSYSYKDLSDQKAALVADIAGGITKEGNPVSLEEGVGQPTYIYVVLPDLPWRIGIGAVFSYYEFTVDPANLMTDEAWQVLVESGTTPPPPEWTSLFLVP
jgi:hypothetical protein